MASVPQQRNLQIQSLCKTFYKPSRLAALKNINCTFAAGSLNILTGNNGAGKSTLLRIISGLSKADKGTVEGRPSNGIGYFTSNLHLYGNLTCQESFNLFAQQPGVEKLLENQKALFAHQQPVGWQEMAIVFIGVKHLDLPVRSMSKGQQVRLALLIALLNGTELLLLDEPTTHLDTEGTALLLAFLRQHTGTVLVATHDESLLLELDKHFPQSSHLHLAHGEIIRREIVQGETAP